MHIPSSMVAGPVCPVTMAVATAGVVAAGCMARRTEKAPSAARFAAVTSLVFAGQMMNFPVQAGTSGHLIGGVLAAATLGVPFGVLSIALVLAVQCLVFSDGGVLALGANVVNMALIGAALGGGLARWASGRSEGWRRWVTLGVAAWFSTVAGAMACAAELAWAGTLAWDRAWAAMLQTHALIGLGEAAITVAVVACVGERAAAVSRGRAVAGPAAAAAVVALMLSPWASVWPDGLEWVAERYAAWHSTAPAFVGPLAEYAVPGIGSAVLSTGLAGLLGVALTFGAAWGISRLWSLRGAGA